MSALDGRIRRLESRMGGGNPAQARVDILEKIETGRICDADMPALWGLMEYEVHASLMLAARRSYGRLLKTSDEPASAGPHEPSASAGPMLCASWTVALPPDEPIDPAWAEMISLHGQRARPLRKGAPTNGLSASQQDSVALWVRSRLLTSAMVEPSAKALREELHRDWLPEPPVDRIRLADPEQLRWLDKVESLLQGWPDIPILRGVDPPLFRHLEWTNVYSDDEGNQIRRPLPRRRDHRKENMVDVTAQELNRSA